MHAVTGGEPTTLEHKCLILAKAIARVDASFSTVVSLDPSGVCDLPTSLDIER